MLFYFPPELHSRNLNSSGMIEHFPCQMLSAAIAEPHILPVQQAVTTGADTISVTTAEHHHFHNRQWNTVGNCVKKGGLSTPLF